MSVEACSPALAYLRQISEGNYISPEEKKLNDHIAGTYPKTALTITIAFGALALVAVYYKTTYHPVLVCVFSALNFGKAYRDINEENQQRRSEGSQATKQMFIDATKYVTACREEKIWAVQQLLLGTCQELRDFPLSSLVEAAKERYEKPTEILSKTQNYGSTASEVISRTNTQQLRNENGKVQEYAAKILTRKDSPSDLCNEWASLITVCRQFSEIGICGLKAELDYSGLIVMQKIVKET